MWQVPRLQSLFGIKHPIIQAPMAGSSSPELVAAVSNAGGLGGFGAAPLSPADLRSTVKKIRALTDKPFNINLFASATELVDEHTDVPDQFVQLLKAYQQEVGLTDELPRPKKIFGPAEDQLAVLIDEKVPVISFHFGIELEQVNAIHAAGLKVICSATNIEEAKHLEALGVDAIIAQGSEAGGHRGTFIGDPAQSLIGTLALVPQVVEAVSIPVIAAGGIMDGRGIVACAALGASAVQMGTAFLGCDELNLAPAWRSHLENAAPSDTTVTTAVSGKPARGIRNRYIKEVEKLTEPLLPYPLQYSMSANLRKQAGKTDNSEFMVMWSGQAVGLFRRQSASELMSKLLEEVAAVKASL
jgi:nitronate monooxygenase